MRNLFLLILLLLSTSAQAQFNFLDTLKNKTSQYTTYIDTLKNKKDEVLNVISKKESKLEATWDQGVQIDPKDQRIMSLIYQLDEEQFRNPKKLTKEQVIIYRELGLEFYNKGLYAEADFFLSKIKDYSEVNKVKLKDVFNENIVEIREDIRKELEKEIEAKADTPKTEVLNIQQLQSLKNDTEFLKNISQSMENASKEDLEKLSQQIDDQIQKLIIERDLLIKNNGSQTLIDSKNQNIKSLKKEKQVIDLNIDKEQLKEEKTIIKRWLWGSISVVLLLLALVIVVLQRKKIKVQDVEIDRQLQDINKKNTYLEHAARIIRHDMHSGINTYIPRGIVSLEKRISDEQMKSLKIDGSIKMIREGLNHTQKVYKSVYEFTNLVKQNVVLDKKEVDIKELLQSNIEKTSYSTQVELSELKALSVNETLFWNAIDNLIKNGLKYNKSEVKLVKIYLEDDNLIVEDNGVGLTQKKFEKILQNHKVDDSEDSGLGLNICVAILKEHGFDLSCEKIETGTKMKIKL